MQLSIIKIGGNILDNPPALDRFLRTFAALEGQKILIHGGGKIATEIGTKMGLVAEYVNGRRITDAATRDLVTMVYGGLINRQLTAQLQALGCNAIGLTGADANIIPAVKRPVKEVDYGWVGDLKTENIGATMLKGLLSQGLTPVLAPLSHDGQGHLLNTNADTIATEVAKALAPHYAVRLVFCFEKRGILRDPADDQSAIPSINVSEYKALQAQSAVSGGILPKLDNAFAAAAAGVERVVIGHADDLVAHVGDGGVAGTVIVGA